MSSSKNISEVEKTDKDPSLSKFKVAVKRLAMAATDAAKTSEGKKLPSDYWISLVKLVKKAKLGISMIDLGIDDLDAVKDVTDSDELELKKTGPIQKMDSAEPTTSDSSESSAKKSPPPPKKKTDDSEDEEDAEDEDEVKESATSKSQQRLFGMVHAYNKGELDTSDLDDELVTKVKKMASSVDDKDTEKFAKTNHDDLPEKVPSNEYYDTINHFSILLSEQNFDSVECDGAEFNIKKSDRNFTIKYTDKFYLLSENYNFELGDNYDLQEVIETFVKLSKHSDTELTRDYRTSSS
jgi:hypothetical protein